MRVICAAIVALLLMTACDGDGDAPPRVSAPAPSPEVDPNEPCAFLSPSQIERAIDSDVSTEREVDSHDLVTRICSYKTTKPWASVSVVVDDEVTAREFERLMDRDPPNTEPVDAIGDGAFIHACASITVLVDGTLVSMGLQHLTTCEETAKVLRALAGEAVSRLT
jgi:hypothetical protein